MADPRQTRAWRVLRDQVLAEEPTCRIQLPEICTTISTEADHIRPVEDAPHLALVRSNIRGACQSCNRARGRVPDHLIVKPEQPIALSFFD